MNISDRAACYHSIRTATNLIVLGISIALIPLTAGAAELYFVENIGQTSDEVLFSARAGNLTLHTTRGEMWFSYRIGDSSSPVPGTMTHPPTERRLHLRLAFSGSNPNPAVKGTHAANTHVSYLYGSDPTRWRRNVPVWRVVRYHRLYPGVDLVIDGRSGQPELQLVVDRTENLKQVQVELHGVEDLESGNAVRVRLPTLEAQSRSGDRLTPKAPWPLPAPPERWPDKTSRLNGVGWAGFLGGNDEDCASRGAMALDGTGAVYLTGHALSFDFPTTPGAFDTSVPMLEDAFVAKISANGNDLEYATFLGGSEQDWGRAITVDANGRAIVTGSTQSDNFPTTPGAFDLSHSGGTYPDDAFVTIVTADGSNLDYSSYLGGSSLDLAATVALDESGHIYVGGGTRSGNFPTTPGAFDPSYNPPTAGGELDAFLVKLNPTGNGNSDMIYGTYLGSGNDDWVSALVSDATGTVHAVGTTTSADFPTTPGAWITSHQGDEDGFAVRLNPSGSDLLFSTLVGAGGNDSCEAVGVDELGRVVVQGSTTSPSFPTTPGAFDTVLGGDRDLFVVKLQPDVSAPVFSTFIGGDDKEYAGATIALTSNGSIYATGSSRSSNFPTTAGCPDSTLNGLDDAVIFALDSSGATQLYGTFLGGWHWEFGFGIAIDPKGGSAVVAGRTRSYDFPATSGSFGPSFGGGTCFAGQPCTDAFVAKIALPLLFADGFESGNTSAWDDAIQ